MNPLKHSSIHMASHAPSRPYLGARTAARVSLTAHMLPRFMILGTRVSPTPTKTPYTTMEAAYIGSAKASILKTLAPSSRTAASGVIISIMAHSTIYNKDIDLELAQRIVQKVTKNENKPVTMDDIINTVCNHFNLETSAIYSKSRKREVAQARQIAMYLAKMHTDLSMAKIGKLVGNKHHSTVLYACKTIEELKEVDKAFRAEMDEIQADLKRG